MHIFRSLIQPIFSVATIGLLSGCYHAGPDFHAPQAPIVKSYTESPQLVKTAAAQGVAQYFVLGPSCEKQWWTVFQSPQINQLVETGLANNPTLAAAQATLRQAQENFSGQRGGLLLPHLDGQLSESRNNNYGTTSATGAVSVYNVFDASVSASYTFDLFGANYRQLEALAAQVDYEQYELQASELTIITNIVTTAITTAAEQAQIDATTALIKAQQKQLNIMQKQLKLGGIAQSDFLAQQTLLAQTEATLPTLQKSLAQSRDALAALVGKLPDDAMLPTLKLTQFTLPAKLPLEIPSALVEKRPDIQASLALLHAASAKVGVAEANLYPQLTLSGTSYGWESGNFPSLFGSENLIWGLGTNLTQPFFHGGQLHAEKRAAVDAFDKAKADYKKTVLTAFQQVADTLKALENDALSLQAQDRATFAAEQTLRISQKQLKLGGVSALAVLHAEQQYNQTLLNKIQAEGLRFSDTAALFQTLGG